EFVDRMNAVFVMNPAFPGRLCARSQAVNLSGYFAARRGRGRSSTCAGTESPPAMRLWFRLARAGKYADEVAAR
ncbi:MAG: hypothetical protein QHJ82_11450, partial [Verrucomicrobiota bacterium]|nr:hypothetical protein [Verrucomicrobiota bacterium]